MDPQQPYNLEPQPQPIKPTSQKTKTMQIVIIALAVVAVILLITVIVFASRAFINDDKLAQANKQGQEAGAAAQKNADEKKAAELANTDVRTYTAPDDAGNFRLSIPKSWSLSVSPNDAGSTITAISNPDYIDTKSDQYSLRYSLRNQDYDAAVKTYDAQTKGTPATPAKLTKQEITVSGIKGVRYTGQLSSKIPNGTVVLLPVRDKTFIIQTDDNTKYLTNYNTILNSIHITP